MKRVRIMDPLLDLASHGRYEGTFPRRDVRKDERLILEWKPSKIMIAKGGPLMFLLTIPGSFTLPFLLLVPLLAFLGVLRWVLDHSIELSITLFLIIAFSIYIFGRISWIRTSYAVTDKAVYIRKGVIFNRVYRTPLVDIKDVKVETGLLERIVKRGTLVFIVKGGKIRRNPKVRWHFISFPHKLERSFRKVIESGSSVDIEKKDVL